jgi:glutamate/tyrosine decarboxylase-like PLP-dependent enzyme
MAQDGDLPRIVIGQAGHIMSGGFDDFPALARLCRKYEAWLHVDGAFGLWCRASPRHRYLANGVELADSWSVDGHKWLQVPYDSGFAIVKDREAHRAAMQMTAGYIEREAPHEPDPSDYVPELSRRARGFAAWAVLQQLGRRGVAEMVERHCRAANLIATSLEKEDGIVLRNDVVLNQIAIGFDAPDDLDAPEIVARRLNGTGRYFLRTAQWRGEKVLRISVISDRVDEQLGTRLASDIALVWRMIRSNIPETKETQKAVRRHMADTSIP